MGAWGYGPLDNDSAADWLEETLSRDVARIDHVLRRKGTNNPDWLRAACWLLEHVGFNYAYDPEELQDHLELAIKLLGELASDEAFLNQYEEPATIKCEIEGQIAVLKERLASLTGEDEE